jgi:hypothetical protein
MLYSALEATNQYDFKALKLTPWELQVSFSPVSAGTFGLILFYLHLCVFFLFWSNFLLFLDWQKHVI